MLSENIRNLRKAKGLSQEELAIIVVVFIAFAMIHSAYLD